MKDIILIVIILVAVGVIFDRRRRKPRVELPSIEGVVSANELPPSETGRFRAQTALGGSAKLREGGKLEEPHAVESVPADQDDEEALPDPFSTTTSDKMSGPH